MATPLARAALGRVRLVGLALALIVGVAGWDAPAVRGAEPGDEPPKAGAPDSKKNGKDEPKEKNGDDEKKDDDKKDDEKDKNGKDDDKEKKPTWYSVHGQFTFVNQRHDRFPSPYTGPHSLISDEPSANSITSTLFLDAKLWRGFEMVFNPEIAGGLGLSGTTGMAGFPNGEITRIGRVEPTLYIARLFGRQTFGFGGEQEKVEDEANQIAGTRDISRFTVTVGKLAATDIADNNKYSHDPRTQFLNWSLMYNGAWDYPANVRGYTYGVGLDFNQKNWALRYGIFAEPGEANGAELDPHILKANGQVLEWEGRYDFNCHPGALRVMTFLNHAHMGNYGDAIRLMPVDPDITLTRAYRYKYGVGANLEQEITKELGAFTRVGWNDGHSETWAFTEIDRSFAFGLLLKGKCWHRPEDEVGFAVVVNGLSQTHRAYLAAGGLGYIIGDGRLNYAAETIIESYYNLELSKAANITFDMQGVANPAYNADRGPVLVLSLRLHMEF
jgi:high affinity Mn2+ porin